MPVSPGSKGGRPTNDAITNFVWEQRILKEEARLAGAKPNFSVRSAMTVPDVPMKFKVGHVDPSAERRAASVHFEPASVGWDPEGADAREFRRNWGVQTEGPRMRASYPQTTYHELGWLLAPHGKASDRVEGRKLRLGFAWPEGPPASFSEVSSFLKPCSAVGTELSAACPSELSAVPSTLSTAKQRQRRAAGQGSGQELSRAGASQLSGNSGEGPPAARYAKCRSMPSLNKAHIAQRLQTCEEGLEQALEENLRYLNRGSKGKRWTRYLNGTDVTEFDDKFTKENSGVPLYKMGFR